MTTYLVFDCGELVAVFDSWSAASAFGELRTRMRTRAGARVGVRIERRSGIRPWWLGKERRTS